MVSEVALWLRPAGTDSSVRAACTGAFHQWSRELRDGDEEEDDEILLDGSGVRGAQRSVPRTRLGPCWWSRLRGRRFWSNFWVTTMPKAPEDSPKEDSIMDGAWSTGVCLILPDSCCKDPPLIKHPESDNAAFASSRQRGRQVPSQAVRRIRSWQLSPPRALVSG